MTGRTRPTGPPDELVEGRLLRTTQIGCIPGGPAGVAAGIGIVRTRWGHDASERPRGRWGTAYPSRPPTAWVRRSTRA